MRKGRTRASTSLKLSLDVFQEDPQEVKRMVNWIVDPALYRAKIGLDISRRQQVRYVCK